jgi:hypothetical protein
MNEKSIRMIGRNRLANPLKRPFGGWMCSHAHMHDPPRTMLDKDEDIKDSERRRYDDKEVTGENGSRVIAEKGGPSLITAWPAGWLLRHVLSNRSG